MTKKPACVLILAILIITHSWSQEKTPEKGESYEFYKKAEELWEVNTNETDSLALIYYLEAISKATEETSTNQEFLYDAYIKSGRLKQTEGSLREAIKLYLDAIKISSSLDLSDSTRFHPCLFIGMAYYIFQEIDSSIIYLEQAQTISENYSNVSELDQLYNTLGVVNYELGNYAQSINFFRKAIKVTPNLPGYSEYQLEAYQSNIASALRRLGEYDSAITAYRAMLSGGLNSDDLFINLGVSYKELSNFDSSLYFFNKVSSLTAILYNNLAATNLDNGNVEDAMDNINKALSFAEDSLAGKITMGTSYRLLGDTYIKRQSPIEALENYQKALNKLVHGFNDSSVYSNPKSQFILGSYNLFDVLIAKASTFDKEYRRSNDSTMLHGAIDAYDAAIKVSDYIAKNFDNDDARIFHSSVVLHGYEQAVELLIYAHEQSGSVPILEKAFVWSEKSKANTLAINLKEGQLKRKNSLPDSLLRTENNLKFQLSRLLRRLDRAASLEESNLIENEILNAELALSRVRNRFHNYPEYYEEKFAFDSVNVDFIRQHVLDKTTVLLSHFYSDSILYQFVLTKDRTSVHRILNDQKYQDALSAFKSELHIIEPGRSYQGGAPSKFVYEKLFGPLKNDLKGIKSLIIVPHGPLRDLPFEALEDATGRYVIEKFDISYQYAASFLQEYKNGGLDLKKTIAIAPFGSETVVESHENFLPLFFSETEIEGLKGIKLIRENATKENFLRYKDSVSIIHLATHAIANGDDPSRSFIAFYPSLASDSSYKLFAHELYNTSMSQTKLAFLSACETAQGKLISGEGIMSLSRAFAYAGCPNMITSLWKAEDHATAFISQRFYTHLQSGLGFSQSLQQAKIDLIRKPEYAQFHSPSYWSHLVFVGSPLVHDSRGSAWVYAVLSLVLISIVVFRGRKVFGPRG